VFPEIQKTTSNRVVVAHNESFDRNVLAEIHGPNLNYADLNIGSRWETHRKIYKAKGLKPTKIKDCCRNEIALKSPWTLSDARACAKLFMLRSIYYRR
jgi:DNA polymerase-3 subunit epsilon